MIDTINAVNSGIGLVKQIDDVLEIFRPYKPEVKRFRIDYLDRSSEIKYLLKIPAGLRRVPKRIVELPATTGFFIDEVFDLDTHNMIDVTFIHNDNKYVVNLSEFKSSENFLVTLRGRVSKKFLDSLVIVSCAMNPIKQETDDCYWIHSALKDVSILERIWDELNIDKVNADVKIGVERYFSSAIPKDVRNRLKIQQKLLDAIASRARNRSKLEYDFRVSLTKSKISPQELYNLIVRLSSADYFSQYMTVDNPFILGLVEPLKTTTSWLPNTVKVGVSTDLNFKTPAVKGNLLFKKNNFEESIKEEIKKLEEK